ncbi:MAG: N-acetylmuramoyl-L-alanine amidase [Spirosomataceae bacterium]
MRNLKRRYFWVSWVSLSFVFLSLIQSPTENTEDLSTLKTVVIDAGHGGKDPGARSKYGLEKVFALDMALRFGKKIEQQFPAIRVIYTRKDDTFIPIHERAAIANKNKANLFVSIHCNANPYSSAIHGTETYVMGLHKSTDNLEVAKQENRVVLLEENYRKSYKGYNPNSPIAHIMLANYQSSFIQQSISFASKVEKHSKKYGNTSLGVKQAGFLVIWETTMPSVLFEAGYLTNDKDGHLLASTAGRERMAQTLFAAFQEYKSEVESNR